MIERLTGARPLPAPLREQILSKTDGVPLFVEELTKAILEADLSGPERAHDGAASPLPVMTIPATLEESLLSRLDRLAPSREVAQLAAAIGGSSRMSCCWRLRHCRRAIFRMRWMILYADASDLLEPLVQAPGDCDRVSPDLDAARQLLRVLQGSGPTG